MADIFEGFETTPLKLTFTGTWTRTNATSRSGSWSYRAQTIADGGYSGTVMTVPPGVDKLVFWYRVSSELACDFFRVQLGTNQVLNVSGDIAWTRAEFSLVGVSQVTFSYSKDGSSAVGSDTAWIDDITLSSPGGGWGPVPLF